MTTPATSQVGIPRLPPRTVALAGVATAVLAGWAFWPIRSPELHAPDLSVQEALTPIGDLPVLEASAFRVPLWVAQAPPPPPPVAPPPPPPLKLQLVAIVHEEGQYRAALYDPEKDELKVVTTGDKVGSRTIASVAKDSVTITEGKLTRTLALDLKPGGAP